MEYLNVFLAIASALILGLLSTRLMKILHLPNVTGYLLVGLIIGPYCTGFISEVTLDSLSAVSTLALGFIAFSIGVEFKIKHLKSIGKSAIVITFFQALTATLFIDLLCLISMPVHEAIIMGAIGTATAPAATLMVVRQYKAKGIVTGTLLPVVALDDAVGLMVFAVSNSIALALVGGGAVTAMNVAVWPIVQILSSLAIGAAIGALVSLMPRFFRSADNRLIGAIACVFLSIGVCELFARLNADGTIPFALSDLLVCMTAGALFINLRKESEEVMRSSDRWTPALFMLFFIFSGAELDVSRLVKTPAIILSLALYLIARSAGKYIGAFAGAAVTKADKNVRNYLGITLLPQAGVAIGMATLCMKEFAKAADKVVGNPVLAESLRTVGANIVTVTMCAVLIYELFGPVLTKWALTRAGEIDGTLFGRKRNKKAAELAAQGAFDDINSEKRQENGKDKK